MKKILLTGGNGFIGKNILESYLAEKYEITAPRSYELNLADTDCVDEYFKNKSFDVVLHAAAKPGHRNAKDRTNLFYSNMRMFENLVRHKDKFGKFVNFGSGAIYDQSKNITLAKEADICKNMPADEHGFCKYCEQKCIEKLENFVDLNIFGIFGKYEDWEIRFISNAVCKCIFNLPVTLRQNRRFSYIFVEDLFPVLEFFIENDVKYSSYNVTGNEPADLLQLAKTVVAICNPDNDIKVAQDGYGMDYTGDNSRLRAEFPSMAFTPFNTAIEKLYDYYSKNKDLIDIELLKTDK